MNASKIQGWDAVSYEEKLRYYLVTSETANSGSLK